MGIRSLDNVKLWCLLHSCIFFPNVFSNSTACSRLSVNFYAIFMGPIWSANVASRFFRIFPFVYTVSAVDQKSYCPSYINLLDGVSAFAMQQKSTINDKCIHLKRVTNAKFILNFLHWNYCNGRHLWVLPVGPITMLMPVTLILGQKNACVINKTLLRWKTSRKM